MAASLPVVATKVGAIPEIIDDRIEGYLIPAGQAISLAEAMDEMGMLPRSDRTAIGFRANENYKKLYSVEAMAEKLLKVYEQHS